MSKILLLIDHRGNRRLLHEALSHHYDVIVAESTEDLKETFDLGIVDGIALDRCLERILERKRNELPSFLPFLFVTARKDVGMATRHLWKSIDELLITPLEKIELQARVESLLKTRQLSQELYSAMIQESPIAIMLFDSKGCVHHWNQAA